jgi:NTE family protein
LREGAYWGIWSDIDDFGLADALDCPPDAIKRLAGVPTRLRKTDRVLQRQLVNWGYSVCDAAMRKHVLAAGTPPPAGFPYPEAGL